MHELSIALAILDIAGEESERLGATRVAAIHVRLGPLAGVIQEALVSAYDMARAETPCRDAKLVIEKIPLVVFCETCAAEQTLQTMDAFCCPVCGVPTGKIVRGRELEVSAIEIES